METDAEQWEYDQPGELARSTAGEEALFALLVRLSAFFRLCFAGSCWVVLQRLAVGALITQGYIEFG